MFKTKCLRDLQGTEINRNFTAENTNKQDYLRPTELAKYKLNTENNN